MKKHFLLLLAGLCCLASCQTYMDGDLVIEDFFTYEQGTKAGRARLIDPYLKNLGYTPWSAEPKDDANLTGEGGNFQYFWDHRGEVEDNESLIALCALPQEQLFKMSTKNLVNTCYIYPYGSILALSNDPFLAVLQHMNIFNGLIELQKRKSAPAELIRLYKECKYVKISEAGGTQFPLYSTDYLNPGHMHAGIPYLTVLLETAVDCGVFTASQISELAGATLAKIEDVYSFSDDDFSYHTKKHPLILGAMIVYHHDAGLTDNELAMIKNFLGVAERPEGIMNMGYPLELDPATGQYHCTEEMIATHATLIKSSLKRLSNQ